jgi:hypothetical protein
VREFSASKQIIVLEHSGSSCQLLFSVPEDKGNIERKAFNGIEDIRSS